MYQIHMKCGNFGEDLYRVMAYRQAAGAQYGIWLCPSCRRRQAKCTACNRNVGKDDDAVSCDGCKRWTHRTCDSGKFT